MLKKFIFWTPLFILASIAFDVYVHWDNLDYRMLSITAALGWLMYWDALNDLEKAKAELERKQDV